MKQQKALAEALAASRGEEVQGLKQQMQDLTGRLTHAEDRVQQGELIRRKLHNTILVCFAAAQVCKMDKCHLSAPYRMRLHNSIPTNPAAFSTAFTMSHC